VTLQRWVVREETNRLWREITSPTQLCYMQLHRLPVPRSVKVKLRCVTHSVFYGKCPPYLTKRRTVDQCQPTTPIFRRLRSTS